jgi:hypothetical protein
MLKNSIGSRTLVVTLALLGGEMLAESAQAGGEVSDSPMRAVMMADSLQGEIAGNPRENCVITEKLRVKLSSRFYSMTPADPDFNKSQAYPVLMKSGSGDASFVWVAGSKGKTEIVSTDWLSPESKIALSSATCSGDQLEVTAIQSKYISDHGYDGSQDGKSGSGQGKKAE